MAVECRTFSLKLSIMSLRLHFHAATWDTYMASKNELYWIKRHLYNILEEKTRRTRNLMITFKTKMPEENFLDRDSLFISHMLAELLNDKNVNMLFMYEPINWRSLEAGTYTRLNLTTRLKSFEIWRCRYLGINIGRDGLGDLVFLPDFKRDFRLNFCHLWESEAENVRAVVESTTPVSSLLEKLLALNWKLCKMNGKGRSLRAGVLTEMYKAGLQYVYTALTDHDEEAFDLRSRELQAIFDAVQIANRIAKLAAPSAQAS